MGGSRSVRALMMGVLRRALLAACSTTVDGSGSPGSGAPTGFPSNPSAPQSAPGTPTGSLPSQGSSSTSTGDAGTPALTCPHITIPNTAKLAFDCLVPGMKSDSSSGSLWIYNWTVNTEASWQASEGVTPGTQDLTGSLSSQLADLVKNQFYGPGATHSAPKITSITVGGRKAQQLETTFTVAPAYRKQKSLKVVTEHLWMLAIAVDTADSTLWYVSVPDTVKQYWSKVPALTRGSRSSPDRRRRPPVRVNECPEQPPCPLRSSTCTAIR